MEQCIIALFGRRRRDPPPSKSKVSRMEMDGLLNSNSEMTMPNRSNKQELFFNKCRQIIYRIDLREKYAKKLNERDMEKIKSIENQKIKEQWHVEHLKRSQLHLLSIIKLREKKINSLLDIKHQIETIHLHIDCANILSNIKTVLFEGQEVLTVLNKNLEEMGIEELLDNFKESLETVKNIEDIIKTTEDDDDTDYESMLQELRMNNDVIPETVVVVATTPLTPLESKHKSKIDKKLVLLVDE